MKLIRDSFLFFCRKGKETLRNPVYLSMGVSTPIIYLLLFAPLLKGFAGSMGFPSDNIMDIFVPGMMVMIAFLTGLFAGWGIIREIKEGVIERFCVAPCSRLSILAGFILRDLVSMFFQVFLFMGVAFLFGYRISLPSLSILISLLATVLITTSAFANALGLLMKNAEFLAPVVHGVNLPTMLLSGILLPISLGPRWLQIVAHFNPLYYVVEASRSLQMGKIDAPIIYQAFAIFIPLALLTIFWAKSLFKQIVA